jgi:methyltransferase-like protein/2-polyprenyl-3-methyl-5-hydroxy-6-metoxy-1,4-benzoquinol methylase
MARAGLCSEEEVRRTVGGERLVVSDRSQGAVGTPTNSYDDVPYDNLAFAQTHPDRLATAARIFDLQPPPIATCRVLELGCASGGNLIPMAFNLPQAHFVGLDLSRRQIERGLETVEALGIGNLILRHASILDVTKEWGEFDYIICHGVFSWVESHVQDAILRIAKENLSPSGVANISYNTYPGWHMREMVRDMMRYHTRQFDEPQEQIEQARALLTFLVSASEGSGPYGELLTWEVERLSCTSDSYLFHEHLEQTNTPIYFHQFIERAERAGLTYLSEASISDMLSSQFQQPIAETLERISPDILHLEQYMDFVRNRQFRQTLLVHGAVKPKRALTPALLHGLMVSSSALPENPPVDLSSGTTVVFSNGGQRADVSLPATKAAFALLGDTWPCAIAVDELCSRALERATPFLGETPAADAHGALMSDLFKAVTYGMVGLHTQAPPCTNHPSDVPRAYRLAAMQARSGTLVVNAHHQMIELEPLGAEVLKLANGVRTTHDLIEELMARVARGEIELEENGHPVTAPEAARAMMTRRLANTLASLARSAVLVG